MVRQALFGLGSVVACTAALAGQIYGTIVDQAGGAASALPFEVQCGNVVMRGTTQGNGAYRVIVPQQGRCTFTVQRPGNPAAVVLSYPDAVQYDFNLVRRADNQFELRRR